MKIEVDPQRDMKNGLCSFCHKPVTLKNGWLEFYVENDEGHLRYPTFDGKPVALFAHAECGPDCGYPIALARMTPATASLAPSFEKAQKDAKDMADAIIKQHESEATP